MLDHRPIRLLANAVSEWPCSPLIPGRWRDVPPAIAVAISAEGARRCDMAIPLPSPIERMRSLRLKFYPGWSLLEGLARYKVDAAGVFRMLLGPAGLHLLDGSSRPIHELNFGNLRLGGSGASLQYLRFFCAAVRGEEGPFSIIEDPITLYQSEALGAAEVAAIVKAVKPLRRRKSSEGDAYTGSVIYARSLYRSRFKLHRRGRVRMMSDELVFPGVINSTMRYDGIWQIFDERPTLAGTH